MLTCECRSNGGASQFQLHALLCANKASFQLSPRACASHGHSLRACQDLHTPWSSGQPVCNTGVAPSECTQSQRLCAKLANIDRSWQGRTAAPPHQLNAPTEREQEQAAGSLLQKHHQRGTLRAQPQPTSGSRKQEEAGRTTAFQRRLLTRLGGKR